jgi:hypothetical protein
MMWSHERSIFLALGNAAKFKVEKGVRHRRARRIHRAHCKMKAASKPKALVLEMEPPTTRVYEKTCGGAGKKDVEVSTTSEQQMIPPPGKHAGPIKRKIAGRRDATVHHRWCVPLSGSSEPLDQTEIKKPRLSFESTSSSRS